MRYEAVIFDLFGTLTAGVPPPQYAWAVSRMAITIGASPEAFDRLWNEALDQRLMGVFPTTQDQIAQMCRVLGLSVPRIRVERAARIVRDLVRASLIPRPHAVDTLARLKAAGYRVGLVSDAPPEVPSLWSTSPFAPYIDAAVFSCEVRVKKPDPAIYHFACTRLGIPPERCLYVGDGADRELTGAARAGLEAVLLRLPGEGAGMSQQDAWQWSGPAICEIPQILGFVEGLD